MTTNDYISMYFDGSGTSLFLMFPAIQFRKIFIYNGCLTMTHKFQDLTLLQDVIIRWSSFDIIVLLESPPVAKSTAAVIS